MPEKTPTAAAAPTDKKNTAPILALPTGFSEDDFIVVGGFTPMYKPKNAFEKKWEAVRAWGGYIDALPEIEDKDGKKRTPLVAVMFLVAPNVGVLGDRTDEKEKALAAGDKILIPLGGNLLWNKDFTAAMFDPKSYFLMRLRVVGQQPSPDYPTDTWMWEVAVNPKRMLRSEHPVLQNCETALPPEVIAKLDERQKKPLPTTAYPRISPIIGRLPSGEVYDKDGVVQPRLVQQQNGA